MQNLDIQNSDSNGSHLNHQVGSQVSPFSSTKLELKQRYMQDFLKDLKKSEEKETTTSKKVLFEEIKGLLADF